MTIKEYLSRNLPNINWNILPQIFEEEGVELTESVKEYLKETPENTNMRILDMIINGSIAVKEMNLLSVEGVPGENSDDIYYIITDAFEGPIRAAQFYVIKQFSDPTKIIGDIRIYKNNELNFVIYSGASVPNTAILQYIYEDGEFGGYVTCKQVLLDGQKTILEESLY